MARRGKRRVPDPWRPETWYLLAATAAGVSALATGARWPIPFALATLATAVVCLLAGLALHSGPHRESSTLLDGRGQSADYSGE